jgi:hypothetical protein
MTREEALAVLKTNYRCMTEEKNCPRTCEGCGLAMQPGELEEAIRIAIKTLEPKTGHWRHYEGMLICSECNSVIGDKPKFCSNCGARMESEE